jgi:hypothetical protein
MAKLEQCAECRGFVPHGASSCPHCSAAVALAKTVPSTVRGVARRLRLGALGGAFGGGAIAFTLMACYGAAPPPPCPDGTRDCLRKSDEAPSATSAAPPETNAPAGGSATPGADAGK